jgi:hypothetical protein
MEGLAEQWKGELQEDRDTIAVVYMKDSLVQQTPICSDDTNFFSRKNLVFVVLPWP